MDYNKRYHDKREELVRRLGGRCVECGTTDQLEFDHIDRSLKTIDISAKITNANLEDELTNIQLLCYSCHVEKTRQELGVEHGGGLSGKRNCPCDLCKRRKSEYMREWKRKRAGVR